LSDSGESARKGQMPKIVTYLVGRLPLIIVTAKRKGSCYWRSRRRSANHFRHL
jgi:hypothetical protein